MHQLFVYFEIRIMCQLFNARFKIQFENKGPMISPICNSNIIWLRKYVYVPFQLTVKETVSKNVFEMKQNKKKQSHPRLVIKMSINLLFLSRCQAEIRQMAENSDKFNEDEQKIWKTSISMSVGNIRHSIWPDTKPIES